MSAGVVIEVIASVVGGLLLTVLTAVGLRLRTAGRAFGLFMRDWQGEPGRPGVAARPGVMERLADNDAAVADLREKIADIHHEVRPNRGRSMKDQLNRLDPLYPEPVDVPTVVAVNPGGD